MLKEGITRGPDGDEIDLTSFGSEAAPQKQMSCVICGALVLREQRWLDRHRSWHFERGETLS